MKKELRLLISLSAVILGGTALAAFLYNKNAAETSPAAASGATGKTPTSYGIQLREELVRPDAPARGPENAALTVVEFLDPECESCKAFHPIMKAFLLETEGQVRFVVRYMAFHGSSKLAIAALESARLQGKYWEMLDTAFVMADEWSHKPTPDPTYFVKYATGLGLDVAKFEQDLRDPKWEALANRDMADGKIMAVRGTPTVFFNGEVVKDFSLEGLRAAAAPVLGNSASSAN
jgi:protein-disulfide isomerase